ncbi:MAG TPA: thioredoxin domain-containing protein [Nitrospirales bacterium]|nr:thioredoxin domain-containing protein [Nitrospirales bacterium]
MQGFRFARFMTIAVLVALAWAQPGAAAPPAAAPSPPPASTPGPYKGVYTVLKEPSAHTPGKVKMAEFADFYCPHCHLFEQTVVPMLEEKFGSRIEITMVGFPVIPGKLPTAFEMYEQAKLMGKGPQMKRVLFRTIHKDRLHMLDRVIRESLEKEVGLDPAAFESGLASGKPTKAFLEGRRWGEKIEVQQTPTVLLDGNIKLENLDPENIKTVIQSILDSDAAKR